MGIKRALSRIPLAVEVKRRVSLVAAVPARRRVLRWLRESGDPIAIRVGDAVALYRIPLPDADERCIARIEEERRRLMCRYGPLVDGSLGEGGPSDTEWTLSLMGQLGMEPKSARLLFLLTRALAPRTIVELGTGPGISSAYMAAALGRNGYNSAVVTLDVSPYRQRLAREVHQAAGLGNISYVEGLFADALPATLDRVGTVDQVCLFGDYRQDAVLSSVEAILPYLSTHGVFLIDGISEPRSFRTTWSAIQADDRLGLVVDLHAFGIATRRDDHASARLVSERIRLF